MRKNSLLSVLAGFTAVFSVIAVGNFVFSLGRGEIRAEPISQGVSSKNDCLTQRIVTRAEFESVINGEFGPLCELKVEGNSDSDRQLGEFLHALDTPAYGFLRQKLLTMDIRKLTLRNFDLGTLPLWVSRMESLQELHAVQDKLVNIYGPTVPRESPDKSSPLSCGVALSVKLLDLSDNSLTAAAVEALHLHRKLENLTLDRNPIETFGVPIRFGINGGIRLPNLKVLSIENTRDVYHPDTRQGGGLKKIGFAGLRNIEQVYLQNGRISGPIALNGVETPGLESLHIASNEVEEIALRDFTSLLYFVASKNPLKRVTLANLSDLDTVELGNTTAAQPPVLTFENLPVVQEIELRNDHFTDATYPRAALQAVSRARTEKRKGIALDLSGNDIRLDELTGLPIRSTFKRDVTGGPDWVKISEHAPILYSMLNFTGSIARNPICHIIQKIAAEDGTGVSDGDMPKGYIQRDFYLDLLHSATIPKGGGLDCDVGDALTDDKKDNVVCGDNKSNGTEPCDGAEFRPSMNSCQALGYNAGTLRCSPGCYLDVKQCSI